jgi:uncharacterized membrane protein YphA (DoxX/SURF4 family)
METTLNKQTVFRLSAKTCEIIIDIITYSFIILFMYTAADKLLTIKSFASTLAKSPLIGGYPMILAWAIPIIEIIISIILIIPSARKTGLQASFLLMTTFTLYLTYMVFSGSKLPCHCGGVISSMTWQQHIWFNLAFVTLAIFGLLISRKK